MFDLQAKMDKIMSMKDRNHGDGPGRKKFQPNYLENKTQRFRQPRRDTRNIANSFVKDEARQMEESNSRPRQHVPKSNKPKLERYSKYAQVVKELGYVRQELSKLKQDMASILQETRTVETENAELFMSSNSRAKEDTRGSNKQITIEGEIKDGETEWAIVVSTIQTSETECHEKNNESQQGPKPRMESIEWELNAHRKELVFIKDQASQFRASMEIIRDELLHVTKETQIFRAKEEKAKTTIHSLTTTLAKAKVKMEATSAAAEKAKSTATNLKNTMEELSSVDQEQLSIHDENAFNKEEIRKTEEDIKVFKDKLQKAMQELDNIKSSEVMAVENLKALIESTKSRRNSRVGGNDDVTISRLEYGYMKGNTVGNIVEVGDKRVRAMKAWVEALRESEKEIVIKGELLRRESRERERMRGERKVGKNGNEEGYLGEISRHGKQVGNG